MDGDWARGLLVVAPSVPLRPELFSSDSDVIGPGIYPATPAMVPADESTGWHGDPADVLDIIGGSAGGGSGLVAALGDVGIADLRLRVALIGLVGTIGEPVLHALIGNGAVAGRLVTSVDFGPPQSPGRIAGYDGEPARVVVNERYRWEHPSLFTAPLLHEFLAAPEPRCDAEESILHAVLTMVHLQLIARDPALVELGTELSRRMNSFAITLFNSRPPGRPGMRLVAPDGPGTIPGGAETMASPDWWSIPFASGHPDPVVMPGGTRAVLAGLSGAVPPAGLTYSQDGAGWIDAQLDGPWLGWSERVQVGRSLNLFP